MPTNKGESPVAAAIPPKPARRLGASSTRYRVKFLIPEHFPYSVAEVIPLDPVLRWNPHQIGDWPELVEAHANVICPPRLADVSIDELLLPYIRHAHAWITDALGGKLTRSNERYEFPNIVPRSKNSAGVYAEGGLNVLNQVYTIRYGRAWLCSLAGSPLVNPLYRLEQFRGPGKKDETKTWKSEIRSGTFGKEGQGGWAPWVYAGDPIVEKPHRPPVYWGDLPLRIQHALLAAIRDIAKFKDRVPIALLAFAIPERWGGVADRVCWAGFELLNFHHEDFSNPSNGFRPKSDMRLWLPIRRFMAANRELSWVWTRDVSREALSSRSLGATRNVEDISIGLLGVGAVGSLLSTALAKLNPRGLLLFDKERVEPGNLVRHEAHSSRVEHPKATAMANQVGALFKNTT